MWKEGLPDKFKCFLVKTSGDWDAHSHSACLHLHPLNPLGSFQPSPTAQPYLCLLVSFLYSSHRSQIVIKTMRPENKPKANKLSLGLARRRKRHGGKGGDWGKMKTSAEKARRENKRLKSEARQENNKKKNPKQNTETQKENESWGSGIYSARRVFLTMWIPSP